MISYRMKLLRHLFTIYPSDTCIFINLFDFHENCDCIYNNYTNAQFVPYSLYVVRTFVLENTFAYLLKKNGRFLSRFGPHVRGCLMASENDLVSYVASEAFLRSLTRPIFINALPLELLKKCKSLHTLFHLLHHVCCSCTSWTAHDSRKRRLWRCTTARSSASSLTTRTPSSGLGSSMLRREG